MKTVMGITAILTLGIPSSVQAETLKQVCLDHGRARSGADLCQLGVAGFVMTKPAT